MSFLHVAFLGGTLTIAIPIVLHLLMRQQPRRLEFPALRFIKLRQSTNRRQVKLRHWLLLALRCAVLGLLALALARPSILATGVLGDQEAPVAAALVFEASPRMQYRQQNKTRLEVAQETAQWLLPQLPAESDVAVVDTRNVVAAFAVDPGAARQRIERLDASVMSQPLSTALGAAMTLIEQSEKQRKEIYVFTDLSRPAWSSDDMRGLQKRLQSLRGIGVYLIDVGATDPSNFGLSNLRLSGQVLSKNTPLRIEADALRVGAPGECFVELCIVDRQTGQPSVRGQQPLALDLGQSQRIEFQLRGLAVGVHQGFVRIAGRDALAADDTRWFTVEVRPAWRVLIAAPRDASRKPADYAFFLSEALAPHALRAAGEAAFDCDIVSTDDLTKRPLEEYAVVCLLDPHPLSAAIRQKLYSYVSAGGGLGLFLGRNAAPVDAFNSAADLLPGKLARQWKDDPEVYLSPENFQHPLLAKFRELQGSIAWELLPVFRHWQVSHLAEGATTVLALSNNQPAVLERPVGKGRVIVMTTPLSDPASRRDTWNLLPTGEDHWPVFMLANEIVYYLAGSGQQRLDYLAGETAVVHLSADQRFSFYSLTTPRGDQIRTPVDERQSAVVVTSTEAAGNYRLQAGGGEQAADLGFSVNFPDNVGQLDRIGKDDLTAIFADTPFRLARNREEIDRSVSAGRVGQELFPYLIVLLVVVLAFEQVLANRFYQDYDTAKSRSLAARLSRKSATKQREADAAWVEAS